MNWNATDNSTFSCEYHRNNMVVVAFVVLIVFVVLVIRFFCFVKFTSHTRIFHSFGDVPLPVKDLYNRHSWPWAVRVLCRAKSTVVRDTLFKVNSQNL